MKRSILALFLLALVLVAISSRAQVVPAATRRGLSLSAGGLGSVFQPDYAGAGIAQASPTRLYGIGAFVDLRFTRWVQIEGEGRWLRFNEYMGIDQNTYLVGPRIPIRRFGRATPYGKVMIGFGNGSFLSGRASVLAYGGGVDYRLTRKFTARADFEYQDWRVTPTLWPYGASVGVSYKIF
jgi:opacity protein-like surface antigen